MYSPIVSMIARRCASSSSWIVSSASRSLVAAEIYQGLGQERERLAPHRVHGGSKEWLKPPFHVQEEHNRNAIAAGTWAGPFRTCEAQPSHDGTPAGEPGSRLYQQNTCGWIAPVMRSKVERTQIGGNPDGL